MYNIDVYNMEDEPIVGARDSPVDLEVDKQRLKTSASLFLKTLVQHVSEKPRPQPLIVHPAAGGHRSGAPGSNGYEACFLAVWLIGRLTGKAESNGH